MLAFTSADHERVAAGEITLSFRLWKYAHVKAGKQYRSGFRFGGRIQVESVDLIPAALISQEDAALCGCKDPDEVRRLAGEHTSTVIEPDTMLYRVQFHYLPEVPDEDKPPVDIDAVEARLQRMDALSKRGAWSLQTLRVIADNPGLGSKYLAPMLGRDEVLPFKADVRKLKYLGLTISLGTGYDISPAGRELLARQTVDS